MTLQQDWDVIVIGAGPAGSVAARELARRGASVLLVERAVFPRTKVCGCCLNAAALATLDALGLREILEPLGAIPLQGVRLAAGRRVVDLPLAGAALSREALDTALCNAAASAGSAVCQGVHAVLDSNTGDRRRVWLHRDGQKQAVAARVIVLASGLAGNREAVASLPSQRSRIGAGIVAARENVPDFYTPGRVFMATGEGGYVGLVRLEDGRLDLGACLGVEFLRASGGPGAAAVRILESVGWPCPSRLEAMPWKGTPVLNRRPRDVAGKRWFAIGDAAGYVEPFTGEGMAWAIQSAAAVVPLVQRAIKGWTDAMIDEWGTRHSRLFQARHRMCRGVANVLRFPTATRMLVRLLSAAPFLARPMVARLNRPVLTFRKVTA